MGVIFALHCVGLGQAVLAAAVAFWLAKAIYNAYFHPLRNVPGPLICKITSARMTFAELCGCRTLTIHHLHERYGDIIRIGPDELAFSNPFAIKEIYGQGSPYMKSAMYDHFSTHSPNLFDMRDRELHKERRKLLSHAFAQVNIDNAEPLIAEQIRKFMGWVQQYAAEGKSMNVAVWFRMYALDIVGSLFLGQDFKALDSDTPLSYLDDLDGHFMLAALKWNMPWVLPLTSWLPIPAWQRFLRSSQRLYEYGDWAFKQYMDRYGRESKRRDLLTKVIKGETDSQKLPDRVITSEVGSMTIGGTDTTSITLTYTVWELAKHPEWQDKIREELRTHNVQFIDGVPAYKDVAPLEALNGCIMEGLRLHSAAPASLPRVAPDGGGVISDIFVPAGTTVSMQAYTLHNNPTIYPSPTSFLPTRWANGGTKAMQESYMPWSKGSRACMGIHLATMEMKLIIAALLRGWRVESGEGTTEESMSMVDHFVLMPKSGRCDLVFRKLEGEEE
ncbi:pisatin demethylase [Saitoella complicata NRRL Y-17804]|nr:pisatin demethylase [Saitoella complicata NRRL Y-17804]ODQ54352.1 pisatin demethylase [Saitoella complicata NRRL Y-17804]